MKGKAELQCLENLKISIKNPHALGKQRMKCNYSCRSLEKIVNIIFNSKANPNESEFPDFVFDGGFIEYFTVSAAKEYRNGSEYRKKDSEINKKWQSEFENEKEEFLKSYYIPNQININTRGEDLDIFTYENFKNSFCRNWDNHINSLTNYSDDKRIGIFLVEYKGALLNEMSKERFIGFYQLNRDKETLQYIYDQRDVLRYVIFTDGQYFEIIAIKDIPELIKSIDKDVAFEGSIEKKRMINIFVNL